MYVCMYVCRGDASQYHSGEERGEDPLIMLFVWVTDFEANSFVGNQLGSNIG